MDYSRLVLRAWQITWRYKFLWIFGLILAFFSRGNGASFNFNFPGSWQTSDSETSQRLTNLISWFETVDLSAIVTVVLVAVGALIILGLLFAVAALILSAVARGALVASVNSIEKGEPTGFRRAFSAGWNRVLSLIGVDIVLNWTLGLLVFLIVSVIIMWMLWPIVPIISESIQGKSTESVLPIFLGTVLSGIAVLACFLLLFIPVAIAVGLVFVLATNVCVVESTGVFRSIGRAWGLFKSNLGPILLIWLILLVIYMIFGVVVGLPVAAAGFLIFVAASASNFNTTVVAIAVALGLLLGVVMMFLSAILSTYSSVLWTLTYLEIVKKRLADNASSSSNEIA